MRLGWAGRHWRLVLAPNPHVNIPLGGHRVLVVGRGRLDRRGTFHQRQPCAYVLALHNCCPGAR